MAHLHHYLLPGIRQLLPLAAEGLLSNLLCHAAKSLERDLQGRYAVRLIHRFKNVGQINGSRVELRIDLVNCICQVLHGEP